MVIDTGAAQTGISLDVARRLQLQNGSEPIFSAAGVRDVPSFTACLDLALDRQVTRTLRVMGIDRIEELFAATDTSRPVLGIIGRDVLAQGTFSYDGRTASYSLVLD